MNDYLQNATLRNVLKTLNIPVPVPPILKRNLNAFSDDELSSKQIVITGKENDFLSQLQKEFHGRIGQATIYDETIDGLVLSCVGMQTIEDLEDLYTSIKNTVSKIKANGRIVIVSKEDKTSVTTFTIQKSIDAFSRALSKEIGGKKGITVNQLKITNEEVTASAVVNASIFFLSDKSSFITGQVVDVSNANTDTLTSIEGLLQGKIAIVTGGARGIGAAAARVLHREGATVIIVDVPQAADDAQALAAELNGDSYLLDISQATAAKELQKYIIEKYGKLDILVNNAGITRDKTIAKMSIDQWRSVLNVNLKAVIQLTQIFIENGFSKDAKVVSLSSISGISGNVGQTNYSLTKAGVIGFSQALAATNKNIFANAVAPGFIETKMTENLPFFIKEGGRRLSTLKQGGKPEDVAELIGFLASPLSNGINGQCVRVCGGNMIGA
ncbi:MAG TPA: 3-oxoacyl-ACP reductase [Chitinophagales bacterium]|nr:3-oxoacyl-ACP reductase [Chitinophagales bacterium]HNB47943.1 3-oxoacyl-ACP reductase [Chitinophagales bacterium]HNC72258.1 3-oxoacyl-ACP reductase [Chitinophagales bacterium]HND83607.1 3-oxoacyl-ACP reductase [Chitinophagales bacterium]HNJ01822.1 3-oxoacyl-ACP reductase [Chitinophagales bacterium]